SYAFLTRRQTQLFDTERQLQTELGEERAQTVDDRDPRQINQNMRLGLDYELNEKTIIGALFSGYNNRWEMNGLSTNRNSFED
ncbi:MAG: hypothetical protein AAGI49_13320, partial [Bacteroidota bacterium]